MIQYTAGGFPIGRHRCANNLAARARRPSRDAISADTMGHRLRDGVGSAIARERALAPAAGRNNMAAPVVPAAVRIWAARPVARRCPTVAVPTSVPVQADRVRQAEPVALMLNSGLMPSRAWAMERTPATPVRAGTRATKDPRHGLPATVAAVAEHRIASSSEVIHSMASRERW
jgi:hypothetical protein